MVIFASVRTAVGDIMMPGYEIWAELARPELVPRTARLYLAIIWFVFFVEVFLMVIMALNFLIAIVGSAYERIMEGEGTALLDGMNDLNRGYCGEQNPHPHDDIEFIVVSIPENEEEEDEAGGIVEELREAIRQVKD